MNKALNKVQFSKGMIRIHKFGAIPSHKPPREISINQEVIDNKISRISQITDDATISVPIIYQKEKIGNVISIANCENQENTDNSIFFSLFAREIAFLIKKYEVKDLTEHFLGKNFMLIGTSQAIRNVEVFIENAAQVNYPVIIEGEFGLEKVQTACAIHYNAASPYGPFIEVNCVAQKGDGFKNKLAECFKKAEGGTLFFNGIDELEIQQQSLILDFMDFMDSHITQWVGSFSPNREKVRIIVSSTHNLEELARKKVFLKPLLAELNFLKIRIPPLRERKEDINLFITFLLKKYRPFSNNGFSKESLELIHNYDWPENLFELERMVARITALCEDAIIDKEHLECHIPEIVTPQELATPTHRNINHEEQEQESPDIDLIEQSPDIPLGEIIASTLLKKDYQSLMSLHPGPQKALQFIGENFTSEISMSIVARSSFVSTSHLSYLFKFYLNKTFKQILSGLRIEMAKQLLTNDEKIRITDISYEVGYGDLSHFEKIFKRLVGVTPREYRQQRVYTSNNG